MPDPAQYPVRKRVESTRSLGQTRTRPIPKISKMSQNNPSDLPLKNSKEELEKMIREMRQDGFSSRKMAGKLQLEYGIQISYKTVQRVLRNK